MHNSSYRPTNAKNNRYITASLHYSIYLKDRDSISHKLAENPRRWLGHCFAGCLSSSTLESSRSILEPPDRTFLCMREGSSRCKISNASVERKVLYDSPWRNEEMKRTSIPSLPKPTIPSGLPVASSISNPSMLLESTAVQSIVLHRYNSIYSMFLLVCTVRSIIASHSSSLSPNSIRGTWGRYSLGVGLSKTMAPSRPSHRVHCSSLTITVLGTSETSLQVIVFWQREPQKKKEGNGVRYRSAWTVDFFRSAWPI